MNKTLGKITWYQAKQRLLSGNRFEGEPCKQGHTIRYMGTHRCVECCKQYRTRARVKAQVAVADYKVRIDHLQELHSNFDKDYYAM